MNFEEWYEGAKEILTIMSYEAKLKEAWLAGVDAAIEELDK